MNSEVLNDINISANQNQYNNAEEVILQKASICDDFMKHEGWKMVVNELETVRKRTMQELLNVAVSDNLQKVQARRYLINAIDMFIESPKKFINQRIMILSRRRKNG